MEEYDDRFADLLRDIGDDSRLIEQCFSFLCRNTDFFKVKENKEDKGYPAGFAELFVRDTFRKYFQLAKQKEIGKKDVCDSSELPIEECVEIVSENCEESEEQDVEMAQEAKNLEEPTNPQAQSDSDSYNGAVLENYTWSQTINEVDIKFKVPKSILKGKQVKVNVTSSRIKIELAIDGKWEVSIDDEMPWRVIKENATWSLIPGDYIHLSLDKTEERWWGKLFVNDPEIDLNKINAVRPMDELPDDEQAKIHELMFDEQQKRQGKPTVQQLKMQNILKEAWDKEGSPFKGQPFDPSIANFYTA